jgi:hypothetical protein
VRELDFRVFVAFCRTQCDRRYEYVLQLGDWLQDTVCARKTRCTSDTQRGAYEKLPAVDANDTLKNGTDAVCANYSSCLDGHYISFRGDDTHDVTCIPPRWT